MELLSCSVLHSFIHPVSVTIRRVHRGSHGSWRPQHADSAGCLCEVSRLSLAVSLMWRRQNLPSLTSGEVLTAAPVVLHGVGPTFFHDDTQNVAAAAAASHCSGSFPLLSYRLPSVSCSVDLELERSGCCRSDCGGRRTHASPHRELVKRLPVLRR